MRTVSVGLSADISKLVTNLDKGADAADRLAVSVTKAGKAADGLDKIGTHSRKVSEDIGKSEKKVSAFGTALTKIDKHSADIDKVSNAFLGVGSAALAGVGLAVKVAADFGASMSNVQASLKGAGLSTEETATQMKALREVALKAGADTAFSASEAAEGIDNLLKAGVSAADVMGGGLTGALDLAAAGELEVADAAEIAATAMTQFGLGGEDVTHIADLLAAGAGKAQGSVGDMGAALQQSGLVASQFGLNIEDTTGALAAFASAGLIGSDAGTSLKTMLLALANPSKESATLMKELGVTAYDAQGNFVGLESLAGQLQEKLGGLDQATRDQALAQIFGNDAVRAANVLYDQGSEGISEWIGKVNDQGYAAETASTKLDNLKGDLEALQGSIETALIGAGEGAQGPIRDFVQLLTDMINKWNELDDATKSNVVKIVATVGGLLVAAGIIGKVVVAGSEMITAFRNIRTAAGEMSTSMPKTSSALGKVGTAASGAAFALTAFYLAAKLASQTLKSGLLTEGAEEAESAIRQLATTGNSAELDKFFQRKENPFGPELYEGVHNLDTALQDIVNRDDFTKFNNSASEFLETVGISTAWGDLRDQLGAIDGELANLATSGSFDLAAKGFSRMVDAVPPEKRTQLLEFFSDYKGALEEQAKQLGVTVTEDQYVEWMGGKVPEAITRAQIEQQKAKTSTDKLKGSMDEGKEASVDYKTATDQLAAAEKQLKTETDNLSNSFTILKGDTVAAEEASIEYEAALDDLRDSTKQAKEAGDKHATSLDKGSESGRKNRLVVLDVIKALDRDTTATFKTDLATKGLDEATKNASKSLKQGKEDIRAAGKAAGLSEKEIDKMIDEMVKTPKELKTEVEATDIKKVQEQIETLEDRIKDLESKTVDITTDFNLTGHWINTKSGEAYKIGNKTVTAFHEGGEIPNLSGAGRKGADTEVILAGVGEHMLTDREVDAIGGHGAVYRLRQAALRGEIRGYRTGGEIRPRNLSGRPRSIGGRPDEEEELNIHGNLAGGKINPKPLMDYYASEMSRLGGDLATRMAKEYVKNAKEALQGDAGVHGDFSKIDVSNPRGHTNWHGGTFTNLFAANLQRAQNIAGQSIRVFQGGFRPTTSYSGTSHAGDAVDLQVSGALIRALRSVGIAAWDRTGKGNWVPHVHAVPLPGAGYAGGSAVWQAQDYKRGGDGLANGGPITGPGGPKDDRIWVRASNGEYMISAEDYSRNRDLVHAIDDGRVRSDRNYIRDYSSPVSYGQTSVGTREAPNLTVSFGDVGYDPDRIVTKIQNAQHDAMVASGMTSAALT